MNFVNRICPKCNNPNYVVSLGNFSKAFPYKCMNCNSYLIEEDFWPVHKDDNNGWISVKDRLPDAAGYECLVCAVNENYNQTHVFTAHTGYGEPGWWTGNVHYMSRATSPSDNRIHPALKVTHWMPLPEPPKEGSTDETHA